VVPPAYSNYLTRPRNRARRVRLAAVRRMWRPVRQRMRANRVAERDHTDYILIERALCDPERC
jgi:hypothetical protein